LAHAPVILLAGLLLLNDLAQMKSLAPRALLLGIGVLLALLLFVANFLAHSVIVGMTVLIVMQLIMAPLRPVEVRQAFAVLKKRWRPLLSTSIRIGLRVILGFILLFVPGIIMMVRYTLYAPVVLIEGLEKKAALKRARELMRRSRLTVIIVVFLQLVLPVIVSSIVTRYAIGTVRDKNAIGPKIAVRVSALINIFIIPLISIMTALLYLKMRQLGGEPLKDILEYIATGDRPRSQWQQRMRERLSLSTRTSRH
jgi:hypothetical protein